MLGDIGIQRWERKHHSLISTSTHFRGRARLGLACQGINPQDNLKSAQLSFRTDLAYYRDLRKQGNPQPANEGFQHLWLANSFLVAGNPTITMYELCEASWFFDEYDSNPESGIKAHWHLINGLYKLREHDPEAARDSFLQAVNIRTKKEKNPMGLALAEIGVARTYFQEKRFPAGLDHIRKAIQAHPVVLLYVANGRPSQ